MCPSLPAAGQDGAGACVSQAHPPVVSERPGQAADKRAEPQEQSGLELVHTGDSQGPCSKLSAAGPAQGPAGPMPAWSSAGAAARCVGTHGSPEFLCFCICTAIASAHHTPSGQPAPPHNFSSPASFVTRMPVPVCGPAA